MRFTNVRILRRLLKFKSSKPKTDSEFLAGQCQTILTTFSDWQNISFF